MTIVRRDDVELTILSIPDCPNTAVLRQRLAEALGEQREVRITQRTITDDDEATRWGMRGSPTLLIDGWDPFTTPHSVGPSVSCRIYRGEDATAQAAPTVAQLRAVLGGNAR